MHNLINVVCIILMYIINRHIRNYTIYDNRKNIFEGIWKKVKLKNISIYIRNFWFKFIWLILTKDQYIKFDDRRLYIYDTLGQTEHWKITVIDLASNQDLFYSPLARDNRGNLLLNASHLSLRIGSVRMYDFLLLVI